MLNHGKNVTPKCRKGHELVNMVNPKETVKKKILKKMKTFIKKCH